MLHSPQSHKREVVGNAQTSKLASSDSSRMMKLLGTYMRQNILCCISDAESFATAIAEALAGEKYK